MKISSSQITPRSNSENKKIPFLTVFSLISGACAVLFVSILSYKITLEYFPKGVEARIWSYAEERGFFAFNNKARLRDGLLNMPAQIISGYKDDVPKVYIDIKFKHLQKIYAKRDEALEQGVLIRGDNDYVPAKIRSENSEIKVKLRLKGDWVDHLEGKKWSFRIQTAGKSHLFGLRRFSIQHPKTRGFQGEALIHEVFSQFDILSPRYSFVDVVINGDNIGIMALEEHFSKELLERNGRKEGVIIRFNESLVWDANDGSERGFGGAFDSHFNAKIDAFQASKIKKSERLTREYATAVGLLRGFTSKQLPASKVFDSELMGRYLAIAQFFGIWHEIRWHNQRFYLNPLTLKLEPIAFDANIQIAKEVGVNAINESFNSNLLKDIEIFSVF